MTENIKREEGFEQVCVWPGTVVGDDRDQFIQDMLDIFKTKVIYLEEIKTNADETGPGGRNDLFFAVHKDDITHFAIQRLSHGIRWIEDVYFNHQGDIYPERVKDYQTWNPF
jgi:hypothetical protein